MAPARKGDVLVFAASVNRAWNTSLEVGVRVEAECIGSTERRHILSAYLTFVAVDGDGKPRPVPPLLAETEIEKNRFAEAQFRRNARLKNAEDLKALRAAQPR